MVARAILWKEDQIDLIGPRRAGDLQQLDGLFLTLRALINLQLLVRMSELRLIEILAHIAQFRYDFIEA
jgi:hypothetical protein